MTDTDTMKLTERFAEALHAVDGSEDAIDAMIELFSESVEIRNSALDLEEQTLEGREGARDFWKTYHRQLTDVSTEFHHTTAGEKSGGLFWVTSGKGADSTPIEYHGATLLMFDDEGLIEGFRGYYDTRQLVLSGS